MNRRALVQEKLNESFRYGKKTDKWNLLQPESLLG
jgi:hypothetical protein